MKQPGFLESLGVLFRANRGYRLVTIANFGDGVAYFGFIALMTLFLERYVGFSLRNATIGESTWSSRFYEYVADIAPVNRVGIYMGVAFIPWFLAKATTGFYAGSMLEIFIPKGGEQSPGVLWLIYAVFALISPVVLLLARTWLISGVSARKTTEP